MLRRFIVFYSIILAIVIYYLKSNNYSIYAFIYLSMLIIITTYFINKRKWVVLFRPTSILLFYVLISFTLGAFAFYNGYFIINHNADFLSAYNFDHLGKSNSFIIMAIVTIFYISSRKDNYRRIINTSDIQSNSRIRYKKILLIIIIIYITNYFKALSIMSILSLSAVIILIYEISKIDKKKTRLILYIILIIILLNMWFGDKRNVLMVMLLVLFLEIDLKKYFTYNDLLPGILVIAGIIVTIIVLSIMRGMYGYSNEAGSIIALSNNFLNYITDTRFYTLILHHLEVYTTYYHTNNAIEYTINNNHMLYGVTYLKALFIFIPDGVISKPPSIISYYTSTLYPQFRAVGGAFSPNIIGEAFVNFGYYGGICCVIIIVLILDKIYDKLINMDANYQIYLIAYSYMPFFFRGSGLDIFTAYVVVSIPVVLLYLKTKA